MLKHAFSVMLSLGFCVGVGCVVIDIATQIPLNQADAVITISQLAGAADATAVAVITDDSHSPARTVVLSNGQAVSVNDHALSGPDTADEYVRTIPAAATYKVTVNEPTRGVEDTTIAAPGAFDITAPAAGSTASLSGFTVTWSNPDPALTVRVRLTQTIFGAERDQSFGPFTDTGSLGLGANDLRSFQQGANLLITVTRTKEVHGINGFRSGTLTAELSQTVTVSPGT
jgi:hypothetical protein